MDAERLHVVLPNRREGDVVIGQRGDGVAIGGVDHEDLLPVALLLLHVGDVIDAEQQEVLLRQLAVGDLLVHFCPSTSCSGLAPSTILPARSEEHTSDLQSLMRLSYAVFCLKQKKHNKFT